MHFLCTEKDNDRCFGVKSRLGTKVGCLHRGVCMPKKRTSEQIPSALTSHRSEEVGRVDNLLSFCCDSFYLRAFWSLDCFIGVTCYEYPSCFIILQENAKGKTRNYILEKLPQCVENIQMRSQKTHIKVIKYLLNISSQVYISARARFIFECNTACAFHHKGSSSGCLYVECRDRDQERVHLSH